MTIRRPMAIAAALCGGILFFLLLTYLFVPASELLTLVNRQLAPQGYSLQAQSFGKALPLGIKAAGLELRTNQGTLVKADALTVRLQLLPLFTGRLGFSLTGRIGAGTVTGSVRIGMGQQMHLTGSNLLLEDIPFFATVTGAQIKGLMQLKGDLQNRGGKSSGTVQLDVERADLRGVKLGETPLPDAGYRSVKVMLRIAGGKATLESFALEGDSLYVRLKGDLPILSPLSSSPLNLTLELMPKPDLLEKQKFIFLILTRYQDTPGHYQIPIRGVLGKPLIQ